jgi:hypothetical protein
MFAGVLPRRSSCPSRVLRAVTGLGRSVRNILVPEYKTQYKTDVSLQCGDVATVLADTVQKMDTVNKVAADAQKAAQQAGSNIADMATQAKDAVLGTGNKPGDKANVAAGDAQKQARLRVLRQCNTPAELQGVGVTL